MSESISKQEEKVKRLRVAYERELNRLAYLKALERIGLNDTEVISNMDLTVRAYNALTNAGIRTTRDLTKMKLIDLYKIENCGKKTVQEITQYMRDRGLSFMDRNDWA